MRIYNDCYFLSPKHIGINCDENAISIEFDTKNFSNDHFFEGIRIKDITKVNRYSEVKIDFNVAQFSNWPILLNEFLRFVADNGKFTFFFRNSKFVTRHVCLNLLRRLFIQKEIDAKLIHLGPELKGELYIFDIKRKASLAKNKDWSIGIIVDGKAPEMLDEFLSSVQTEVYLNKYDQKIEVIINGPMTKEYNEAINKYDINVRCINTGSEFNHLGWITQKKNAIVNDCKYENIALFHNRYSLKPGWLKKLENFGYDFEIISLKQIIRGSRFPDWVAAGSMWSLAKSFLLDPNDYHPNLYINGSVIVAKKWVLEKYPLNEFLFWNQAEDLEHTSHLIANGILPRYASEPSVKVLGMREGFMKGFKKQNKLFQAICGYEKRISHFSPIYIIKDRIKSILNA